MSSQRVGVWLKALGLRDMHGKPTEQAKADGTAVPVSVEGVGFFAWDKERTIALLQQAGHKLASEQAQQPNEPAPVLVGPFTARPSDRDADDFEIIGNNGKANVRVRGQKNSEIVATILTLAHRCGKLTGDQT